MSHIGKVAIYSDDLPLYHGTNLLLIKVDQEKLSPDFLYFILKSYKSKVWAQKHANQAVNQASINKSELKKELLNIPINYDESYCISEGLKKVTLYIAANERKRFYRYKLTNTFTILFHKNFINEFI